MSQGRPIALEDARARAEELVALLRNDCERIEIAGSIRREKATVADIEIVAIPKVVQRDGGDLWGTPVESDELAERIDYLRRHDLLSARDVEVHRKDGRIEHQQRVGESYQALVYEDMPVDLFIVRDPDQWGVIFTIRTGPAEWSHRLVTDCQRYLRRVAGGYLYRSGQRMACPEERDFFDGIGQPWVAPRDRHPSRVAVQSAVPSMETRYGS